MPTVTDKRRAFQARHLRQILHRPIERDTERRHRLHHEEFEVSAAAASRMQTAKEILAVGTTTVRTLETLMQRFDQIRPGKGVTDIFIRIDPITEREHVKSMIEERFEI